MTIMKENYVSVYETVADKHEILIGYMKDGTFISNPPKKYETVIKGG